MLSSYLRGEKLEEVYNGGDIQFFKKFWGIGEQEFVQVCMQQIFIQMLVLHF